MIEAEWESARLAHRSFSLVGGGGRVPMKTTSDRDSDSALRRSGGDPAVWPARDLGGAVAQLTIRVRRPGGC